MRLTNLRLNSPGIVYLLKQGVDDALMEEAELIANKLTGLYNDEDGNPIVFTASLHTYATRQRFIVGTQNKSVAFLEARHGKIAAVMSSMKTTGNIQVMTP